ncbi:hemolysin family protein [Nitriliruptor alkaliphilus]|uniref:hemolysin family protein n=1 Tax=Nitriliruptor alkaliphilus TaxID=427918 RepID=UPI0009F8F62D|nr:hemolysin family protein [Nitriliruptor alkaliphilus]
MTLPPTVLAVAADAAAGSFSWPAIALGVALLVLNGGFVAVEIALLAARRTRVEEAAEAGDPRAARSLASLTELSVTFSGAQLGITMCSLGLGAVAEPAVASLFAGWLGGTPLPVGAVPIVAVVLALSLVVFLHMVVGEMAPKNLALARAEPVAFALARPFSIFVAVLRPLIVLLNGLANLLVRAVRVEPVDEHKLVHTAEELLFVVTESGESGTIEPHDARVLTAALRLAEIDAESAMTARVDLVTVPDDATVEQLLAVAAETGHTRLPVFHEDVDHVVGIVHVKDLLVGEVGDPSTTLAADVLRPVPAVPESRDLESLLREMLEQRSHAALVIDEYGGTAGLVTLEDVLEELVGEIDDEFDDTRHGTTEAELVWIVPGMLRRDELERMTGLDLAGGEAETVSGWVTERIGRLLEVGDRWTTADGWLLTVLGLDGRRADRIEVRSPEAPAGTTAETGVPRGDGPA